MMRPPACRQKQQRQQQLGWAHEFPASRHRPHHGAATPAKGAECVLHPAPQRTRLAARKDIHERLRWGVPVRE